LEFLVVVVILGVVFGVPLTVLFPFFIVVVGPFGVVFVPPDVVELGGLVELPGIVAGFVVAVPDFTVVPFPGLVPFEGIEVVIVVETVPFFVADVEEFPALDVVELFGFKVVDDVAETVELAFLDIVEPVPLLDTVVD